MFSCKIKLLHTAEFVTGGNQMTDNLTIVRAVYSGQSQRQVAVTHRVSRNTVALLVQNAKAHGWLTLEDLSALDNAAFSQMSEKQTGPTQTT